MLAGIPCKHFCLRVASFKFSLKTLQYIFLYPLLYGLSLLPFRVLYILSDVLYVLGYKWVGYRVKLVKSNLRLAFPEKSSAELKSMMDAFYHNFFDIFLETIKLLSISEKQLRQHVVRGNVSVLTSFYTSNTSVVLASGHFGNWEMLGLAYTLEKFPPLKGVYKPVSNAFFDELMKRVRTKFGGSVYAMEETMNRIRENRRALMGVGLLADQNPSSHNAYWFTLMGRETPVFTSVEMIARRFDFPVVYWKIKRLGRGKYEYSAELMFDKPRETKKFEITHAYIERIERDIRENPANWLWTHNRWKRRKADLNKPVKQVDLGL